jgi:hypothetical protein
MQFCGYGAGAGLSSQSSARLAQQTGFVIPMKTAHLCSAEWNFSVTIG